VAGDDVTVLLNAWRQGDLGARDRVMTLVYRDLRRRAAAQLRRELPGRTLQPTALVHEAYLQLVDQRQPEWQNRAHFFGVASRMMRRILVDRARRRKTAKRSGRWARLTLDEASLTAKPIDIDVLALDAALTELADLDPRKTQIAELRFFSGCSLDEAGRLLGISLATAERDWQTARAWLLTKLSGRRTSDA
jgi:RNA polymerase sigma factor (TIGR02999 family)